ncbi:MAG: copper resistance protein CopC [Candidatus Nitrosocosmicus sp.]|nr:copper resistance protein CopC [Candidatus Nitrosocosmicus sp.]MDN5867291.1 copper resistance protein CopC [Candidatus Nitrosocosmicus sp.]
MSKYNLGHFSSCALIQSISIITLIICFSLIAGYSFPEVYGHAFVISTDPSPGQILDKSPEKLQVNINEPVDLTYSKISVIDSNGERVDNADLKYVNNDESKLSVTVPADLGEGTYTVSVQMLSQIDGHLTQDTFVFGIGKQGMILPSSNSQSGITSIYDQISVGSAIARFPSLVGQVMVVGSAFCMLWLWKPLKKINWLNERFLNLQQKTIENKTIYLILIGSIILVLSDFAMIISLALTINASIFDAINTGVFGSVWFARTVISFNILFFALYVLYRRKKKSVVSVEQESDKRMHIYEYLAIFLSGIGALLTTSLMGHAAAVSSNFLYVLLDFAHNVAASLWIGGVFYLAFVVVPSLRSKLLQDEDSGIIGKSKSKVSRIIFGRGSETNNVINNNDYSDQIVTNSLISIIIPRFSFVPVIILGTILLTGPFLLYVLENDLSLTLSSLYGKILIAKLILAGMMIIMGSYYQIVLYNRSLRSVVRYTHSGSPPLRTTSKSNKKSHNFSSNKMVSRFNVGLKMEVIFGILLLGTVAILTSTGLPESEEGLQENQPTQYDTFLSNTGQPTAYINTVFIPNAYNNTNIDSAGVNISNAYTKVLLSIEPYLPGPNKLRVSFLDPNNNPIDFDRVKLKMTFVEESTSPISVTFAPIELSTNRESTGVFSTNTSFGFTGKWEIEVEGISNQKNMPNIYTVFDAFVKPSLDQMSFNVTEFKTTIENISGTAEDFSQPLYPVYDPNRNVIWTGDTVLNSGRILEYNLDNASYTEHKINGTRIISQLALDSNDNIWYLDPLNRLLGYYNPQNKSNENYLLFSLSPSMNSIDDQKLSTPSPSPLSSSLESEAQGVPSALAVDSNNDVWITVANTNLILKFNHLNKTFTKIELPSLDANPLSITFDDRNSAWIAESGSGRIAKVTSQNNNNYLVREFYPNSTDSNQLGNASLNDPIFITTSPFNDEIFISEHEGNVISIFDPITETFRQLALNSKEALPFGMVFDKYHNLWIAEHLTNKITVMDPITGKQKRIDIPTSNPFVQYLTTDKTGQVWFAEQRESALARIDTSINSMSLLSQPSPMSADANTMSIFEFIAETGFEKIAAPLIALGIIFVSVMYVRTTYAFSNSIHYVEKIENYGNK